METRIDFKKQNIPFTQVANAVLYDKNLSLQARAIYAFMYSKPDGWQFSAERIGQEVGSSKPTILKILHELMKGGYLLSQKLSTGRMLYKVVFPPIEPESKSFTMEEPKSKKAKVKESHGEDLLPISNTDKSQSNIINGAVPSPYDWNRYIEGMKNHKDRRINIIGFYFFEKKKTFDTKEKAQAAIKRHLRAAKELLPFTNKEIGQSIRKLNYDFPKFTLETVLKDLTK